MKLSALYKTRYLKHITRALKPSTVAEYKRLAAAIVLPEFGQRDIASLTMSEIEDWHAEVPGKIQANRALALLSSMLSYAALRVPEALDANPCRGISRNREQGREFFYMPADCQRIIHAALAFPDIRGKYIALTLLTGARPGELVDSGPGWRHGNVLRTPDGKTGGRVIYLPRAACAILDGLEGRRYFPAGMDLRRAWVTIMREAKVDRARMYDLRHTFASSALAAGESLAVVGQLLGHRKAQTTMKYVHLAPDTGLKAAGAAAERMGVK